MNSSLIEADSLSLLAKEKGFSHCFVYRGLSMIPTFRNGDFLYTRPTIENHVKLGDVVVFSSSLDKKEFIVHRIVAICNRGFITRGDHNLLSDVLPISIMDIIGKVEIVENKRGIRRLMNGNLGLWLAIIWHLVFGLDHIIRRVFWMPYNIIRGKHLMFFFWKPKVTKVRIHVENTQHIIKYLNKNRTIATWDPSARHFECRKPFDLVIISPLDEPEASS